MNPLRTALSLSLIAHLAAAPALADCIPEFQMGDIVANSLRSNPSRQEVATDMINDFELLAAQPIDLDRWVSLGFRVEDKKYIYLDGSMAGRLVVLYRQPSHSGSGETCTSFNLDDACSDASVEEVMAEVDTWLGNETRLVVVVDIEDGLVVSKEAVSLKYEGLDILNPGMSYEETLNFFLNSSSFQQCGSGGPVLGV